MVNFWVCWATCASWALGTLVSRRAWPKFLVAPIRAGTLEVSTADMVGRSPWSPWAISTEVLAASLPAVAVVVQDQHVVLGGIVLLAPLDEVGQLGAGAHVLAAQVLLDGRLSRLHLEALNPAPLRGFGPFRHYVHLGSAAVL